MVGMCVSVELVWKPGSGWWVRWHERRAELWFDAAFGTSLRRRAELVRSGVQALANAGLWPARYEFVGGPECRFGVWIGCESGGREE